MEYIRGISLLHVASEELPRHCDQIVQAIMAMHLTTSSRPGPADGGEPRGNFWAPDYRAYQSFNNMNEVEA